MILAAGLASLSIMPRDAQAVGLTFALSDTTAAAGATITASGHCNPGWAEDSAEVLVWFESDPVDSVRSTVTQGHWTGPADPVHTADWGDWSVELTVPSLPAGDTGIRATCNSYNGSDPQAYDPVTFTVEAAPASISLSSAWTGAGGSNTVTGSGFAPGETVRIVLQSDPVEVGVLTANGSGAISGSFVVPRTTEPGAHTVVVTGATSARAASSSLSVRAAASIGTITRVGCTALIPVATSGGGSSFSFEVWDDGTELSSVSWVGPVDEVLTWTMTQPIAQSAPGVGFYVESGGVTLAEVGNWDLPAEVAALCTSTPPVTLALPGYPGATVAGETVAVSGSGYLPGEEVVLTIGGVVVGTALVSDEGTFSGSFTVPSGTDPGAQTLTATGAFTGRSAQVTLTVLSPPARTTPASAGTPAATPTSDDTPAPATTASLADTGTGAGPALLVGAGMTLLAGVWLVGRRRRTT